MAQNQRPIGVVSRPVPDWFSSYMSGGHALQAAVAGQNSYIGVYNNASDGSVMRVYAITPNCSSATFVYLETIQGQPGTLYTADNPYGAIDPRIGATWGQLFTFTSAVCIGTHLSAVVAQANTDRMFAPGWPLAIVPPGYSFALQTRNVNVQIESGFWWLSAYN